MALFAVLNPRLAEQVVLLQETRALESDSARVAVADPDNPVVAAGERPISGARVVLYGPAGDSAVAIEDRTRRTDGKGAGVYRIWSGATSQGAPVGAYMRIRDGARYRLRVASVLGTAHGATTVPSASIANVGTTLLLNVERDTLRLPAGVVAGGGFMLRAQSAQRTPYGVGFYERYRRVLGDGPLFAPVGDSSAAFEFARDRLVPGVVQQLSITAVDSNYYAYLATDFDPFGDQAHASTLIGAAGVFGAAVVAYSRNVDLVATVNLPFEGRWVRQAAFNDLSADLRLYAHPNPDFPDTFMISGSIHAPSGTRGSLAGSAQGDEVMLDLFNTSGAPLRSLRGRMLNGLLVMTDVASGVASTYRKP